MTSKRKNDKQHSETPQKIIKSLSNLDSFTIFDILGLNNDITIHPDDMIIEYDDIDIIDIELCKLLNDDDVFVDIFINL